MAEIFYEQKMVTVFFFTFLFLALFLKSMLGLLYKHLIREVENMSCTDNKLLKQCKNRFSNCYEMNHGVQNVEVFVDKFVCRLSLGPFSFPTLNRLSGQFLLFAVFCAGVGICKGILDGDSLMKVSPYYIVSFLGLYLYFSLTAAVDLRGKRKLLKISLIDFLENHMSPRMSHSREDIAYLEKVEKREKLPKEIIRTEQPKKTKTIDLFPMGERNEEKPKEIKETLEWTELEKLLRDIIVG